jgi:hypothetical protein
MEDFLSILNQFPDGPDQELAHLMLLSESCEDLQPLVFGGW